MSDEPTIDPRTPIRDLKLFRRAVRARWPITQELMDRITKLASDLAETSQEARVKLAAVKVLADMDKINATREATDERSRTAKRGSRKVVNVVLTVHEEVVESPKVIEAIKDEHQNG